MTRIRTIKPELFTHETLFDAKISEPLEKSSNLDMTLLNTANTLKNGSDGLLTKKEALVASFLVSDHNVNEIAEALCRSRNTIKMHIRNMKKKCKCGTQTRFGAILQGFIKNRLLRDED